MPSPRRPLWSTIAAWLVLAVASGCSFDDPRVINEQDKPVTTPAADAGPSESELPTLTPAKGLGDNCTKDPLSGQSDCRLYLKCLDGVCQAVGDTPENNFCFLSAECAEDLYCASTGVCARSGDHTTGALCITAADCESGLYCQTIGITGVCADDGPGDVDDPCTTTGDCLAGLVCDADNICNLGALGLGAREPWSGVTCDSESNEPARVHFEIPRGQPLDEYFRQPFPSDIRRNATGQIAISDFPSATINTVHGQEPVRPLLEAISKDTTGFSLAPTVYFRFSQSVDFSSVTANSVRFVNIDPDSPQYGWGLSYNWTVTDGGGKYICKRYLALKPSWASSLQPNTRYAAILTTDIRTNSGLPLERSIDFETVLSNNIPAGAFDAEAHAAYAPLRAYLNDAESDLVPAQILAAAVFTTQAIQPLPQQLRDAVSASEPGAPTELTLCDGNNVSPCDDGYAGSAHVRGCFEVRDEAWELHMKLPIPTVQEGTRPYLNREAGGALRVDSEGIPQLGADEEVCVSLTIPKDKAMPAEGWPWMLYAHDTGENFRAAAEHVGLALTHTTSSEGVAGGVVTVSWEAPMHGSRQGAEFDPEALFLNLGNPRAARGNIAQGVVDVFALVQALKTLDLPATNPTGEAIVLNPDLGMITGQGQGALYGIIAAAYEPALGLTVWSSAGGALSRGVLTQTQPLVMAEGLVLALQELNGFSPNPIGELHPVLPLIQTYLDGVDPMHHARLLQREPLDELAGRHILHFYGLRDGHTPPTMVEPLAHAFDLDHVRPVLTGADSFLGASRTVDAPLSGNRHNGTVTAGLVQLDGGDAYDGHEVLTRDVHARRLYQDFVGSYIAGEVPVITAPQP